LTDPQPSLARRIASSIGWLAVAQVARRLSGLVVTAVLARLLPPEDFGLVALASLATLLFGIITEFGLTSSLIQRKSVDDTDLSTGFWLGLVFGTVLAAVGYFAATPIAGIFSEPRIVPVLRVMLITLPIAALGQVPGAILQRNLDFRKVAHIDWSSGLLSGILGVAAAYAGFGLWALVIQFVSATLLNVVLRQIVVRWRPIFVFSRRSARAMLGFGSSMAGLALVNYAAVNVDNALIGARIGTAALGYYMLAYNLILLPSTNIGGLVTRVMFPALSSLQSDRYRFAQAYAATLRLVAVATLPLVIGLGATAPVAIPAVYGPQWEPSIVILAILTGVGAFQAVNVSGVVYSAIGRPQLLLAWASFSVVVMAIAFIIGSRWGLNGVAWSYLIVSPIVFIPPHLIANHLIGLPQREFVRMIGVPLLSALIMGGAVVLARRAVDLSALPIAGQLLVLASFGAVVYVAALLGFAWGAGAGEAPIRWITRQQVAMAEERAK